MAAARESHACVLYALENRVETVCDGQQKLKKIRGSHSIFTGEKTPMVALLNIICVSATSVVKLGKVGKSGDFSTFSTFDPFCSGLPVGPIKLKKIWESSGRLVEQLRHTLSRHPGITSAAAWSCLLPRGVPRIFCAAARIYFIEKMGLIFWKSASRYLISAPSKKSRIF